MFFLTLKVIRAFPMPHLKWIGFLCLLVIGWNSIFAQDFSPTDELKFENLSGQHGLPQGLVWSIEQDREGFMWFGTEEGLYKKYDGHSATLYQVDPSDPKHSLRHNFIIDIHEDRNGQLWIATMIGGLHQVDKRTGKIKAFPVNPTQVKGWDHLESIYEDQYGIFWMGTGLGIARFDPATQKYTLYPSPNESSIRIIRGDAKGILWVYNEEGVYQFEPKTSKFTFFPVSINSNGIWAIHLDADGILWAVSSEGLFRMDTHTSENFSPYNPGGLVHKPIGGIYEADNYLWLVISEGLQRINKKNNQIYTFKSELSLPGSLSSNFISAVYQDRTGNLWIGTLNGVNKTSIRRKPFYLQQIIPTLPSFHRQENTIVSILKDHTGTLWLSSSAKGLYQLDSSTQQLIHVVVNPNTHGAYLSYSEWPLAEDQYGRLWVGTDSEKGLYQLDRSTGKFIRHTCQILVRRLKVDPSGKLWLCGWMNDMAVFDPATGKFTYFHADEKNPNSLIPGHINDLMVSRNGEIWVATFMGLSRLDPKTGQFTRFQPRTGQLNDQHIETLYEDREGIIWIGTFQGGLNRFDPHTNTFTAITTKQGLPGNRITSIIGDEKRNLWLATNQGLCRFNPERNTFRNFDIGDGLPGNEFLVRGSVFSQNGKLFLGHKNGLISFYPDSIPEDQATFPVYITGLSVFEESRPLPKDTQELLYDENFLTLTFAALNYTSPEKVRYAYQLKGVDKNWVHAGSYRVARYTDLSPGKYTFRVKATIDEQVWNNQEDSLTILIHPPFWRTPWAYAFYGLCFLAGVLAVDHYQRHRLIRREQEKAKEREIAQASEIEKANKALAHQKEELQSTLEHLKATQAQLVQKEKAELENQLQLERLKQEQELAAYQSRMVELEMQALRAQMNPHFIFNCLNSINRFILKNESEAASDYLTKFSRLIRLILQNSQSKAVALENELEALRLYIEMEVLRFEGQFSYQIIVDPYLEVEEVDVPPLIIQPYVENAIWHGLMHKQGQGHLVITLYCKQDIFYCQITDDGVGRKRAAELKSKSASKNKSLGMQITSHRLELINALSEKETTVEVTDLVDPAGEPCGTRVVVKIPV